ncbi:MAG: enolase C-terminal domain-like protein [Candidatus Sericytochromatia bacterium]
MLNWEIEERVLDLKFTWKISRNASDQKRNFFVKVSDKNNYGLGEIAPNVRYNETPEIIISEFNTFLNKKPDNFDSLEAFSNFLDSLNLKHALRFGLEAAYIHYLCDQKNIKPSDFFNLTFPEKVDTSFSMPIIPTHEIKEFLEPLTRFNSLKIKVNQETALEMIREVSKYTKQKLRVDGNEGWTDINELIKFVNEVKDLNIEFIEQPMPSKFVEEYQFLKKNCPFDIIADESIEDKADYKLLSTQFHGVNMKLMKAGGYINGLKILNSARENNLKTMIGCMIETSLGIYSAYNLSYGVDYLDLDGCLLIKNDDFKLLEEKDGFLYKK